MGRTITRWDEHPNCLAIDSNNAADVSTDLGFAPDRIYVTCDAPVTLSYKWNNTADISSDPGGTSDPVLAAPTTGQSRTAQGVRFLRATETQVIELAGGARYFHHRVNSGTPLLTLEYGRSAGAGS